MTNKEYKRNWEKQNPDKTRNYRKKWRAKNKIKCKRDNKDWMEKNKEYRKDYMDQWREKRRGHIIQYSKKYNLENKEKIRPIRKKYSRLYQRRPEIKSLKRVRAKTYSKLGKAKFCAICNYLNKINWHHFQPYAWDNIIPLCQEHHKKMHSEQNRITNELRKND